VEVELVRPILIVVSLLGFVPRANDGVRCEGNLEDQSSCKVSHLPFAGRARQVLDS
jgi:hypothetical protein